MAEQDFTALVERVRNGPPRWSPMALPPLDRALNTLEYFVHHEDIRRAAPGWVPRELTDRRSGSSSRASPSPGRAWSARPAYLSRSAGPMATESDRRRAAQG